MDNLELEEIKNIELNILDTITEICEENNLKYSLMGGSGIGAIRHKGFIPWDDDIDIMMLREDYNKLKKITFMSSDIQEDYNYYYAKVVSLDTEAKETGIRKINNYGVFVDIFPVDAVPEDVKKRKCFFKKLNLQMKIINLKIYDKQISINKRKLLLKTILSFVLKPINLKKIVLKTEKEFQKYNLLDCEKKYCLNCSFFSQRKDLIEDKNFYYDVIKVPYESTYSYILRDYDKYLKGIFGDYMKMPPENQRKSNHNWDYIKKK